MKRQVIVAEWTGSVHRVRFECGHEREVTVETYEAVINGEANLLPCDTCTADEGGTMTVEEAMERLDVTPDYDPGGGPTECVHTFAQSAVGLLGAHWTLDAAREFMEKYGVEEAGDIATRMRHGLVVVGDGRTIFFATK